jgi:hypothetical protein
MSCTAAVSHAASRDSLLPCTGSGFSHRTDHEARRNALDRRCGECADNRTRGEDERDRLRASINGLIATGSANFMYVSEKTLSRPGFLLNPWSISHA